MWLPRRDMTGGPTPRRPPARARRARHRAAATTGDVTARPFRVRAADRPSAVLRPVERNPPGETPAPPRAMPRAGAENRAGARPGSGHFQTNTRPTRGLPEAYLKWRADGPRNRSPDPRRRLAPDPARRRACPGRRRARRPVRAPPGAWLRASGRVRRRGQRAESDEFSRPGTGLRRTRPRPALPPCARPRRVPCHGQGIRAGRACRAARSRPADGAGAREMTRFSPTRLENTAKVGLPPDAEHGLGARAAALDGRPRAGGQ